MTPTEREALRRRYLAERDKRLRPDGNAQYIRLQDQFAHYLTDPYTPLQLRPPVTEHVQFAFIGAGFAGLVTGARLREAGFSDVRLIDKGGDVGGTWYWNRYPGAQCDTASLVYMPLLEETGYMPTEKYAHAPEILAHCRRIARHYGLYDNALLHTQVTGLCWDETRQHWLIYTDRGDAFSAQFVGIGTGPLHVPKLPGIAGIERFQGHSFHTSRWDYDYTGGDPAGAPLHKLADKRVAIIGTGATAVQCVPHLAQSCGHLYVFQRTPSSVDVRNNAPLDPAWFASIATPGWQQRWLDNFTANQTLGNAKEDLVMDGWTDLSRRISARLAALPADQRTAAAMLQAYEDSDFEKMAEIRARVDALVQDPAVAEKLKAWYFQLCKRPCFHDEYLQAFNRPNLTLVDTDGKGVEAITEDAVVAAGQHYPVDCIIYASGFEVGTPFTAQTGYDVQGRQGQRLSSYWEQGMRTLHGTHVHGFPNLFIVQAVQGANLISNVPHNLTEAGKTIAAIVRHARDCGARTVEVSAEAEQAWIEMLQRAPARLLGNADCTPGYYNNEGQPNNAHAWSFRGYPAGASAYFKYLRAWREQGEFAGLTFI